MKTINVIATIILKQGVLTTWKRCDASED